MLICVGCGANYPLRGGRQNLRDYCQPCAVVIRKENVRAYDRARSSAGYARRDADKARAYARAYKAAHPEWNRAHRRLYQQRHPEQLRIQMNRRRARQAGVVPSVTLEQFWAKCAAEAWACRYCGTALDKKTATMDHAIPLCAGGSDGIGNIAPACRPCNTRKGQRVPDGSGGADAGIPTSVAG